MALARRLAAVGALLLAGACSRGLGELDADLTTADGARTVSLKACATPKCLTVYVAPWCGVCRGSTRFLLAFRRHLKERGVESRVIVGKDQPAALKAYAAEFGPDTLLDPAGALAPRGVPQFLVTDAQGKILQVIAGAHPLMLESPFPPSLLAQMEQALGLP